MKDSCEHVQCQDTANRAAWLASADTFGAVTFIDLARSEPGLRPFSVDCSMSDVVLYMRDEDCRVGEAPRFWMLRLSEVTDPDLIRKLADAARAGEPVTE